MASVTVKPGDSVTFSPQGPDVALTGRVAALEAVAADARIKKLEGQMAILLSQAPMPPPPVIQPAVCQPTSAALIGIDFSGVTNVQVALQAALNGVTNGTAGNPTLVYFPCNGAYKIDQALKLQNRQYITFAMQGCTITSSALAANFNENYSIFYFVTFGGTNSHVTLYGGNLVGSSTSEGVFVSGKEGQHGVLTDGGNNFEIYNMTSRKMWGDFLETNSNVDGVNCHDNHIINTGRNAFSDIWGKNVEFHHNLIDSSGYMPFDVEPNNSTEPCSFVNIHHNSGAMLWTNLFFACEGGGFGAAIHDISVEDNVSTGSSIRSQFNPNVASAVHEQNVQFNRNQGAGTLSVGQVTFRLIDGLNATGNIQSVTGHGALCATTSCTAAVITPNTT